MTRFEYPYSGQITWFWNEVGSSRVPFGQEKLGERIAQHRASLLWFMREMDTLEERTYSC